MTPRLFLGNFDFEHRLAEPTRESPARLQRLNAELATAWLSVANDGDWIWTPVPIDAEFFREAQSQGLPRVFPATSFSEIPKDVECVPWGWSTDVRMLSERYGWHASAPSNAAVRRANSRATSDELERRWGIGLENARRIESVEQLASAIHSLRNSGDRWVVKSEFGMSGRERILGRGAMTAADANWLRRRLLAHGVAFFEPWVECIGEVGIQINVPEVGGPQLIGLAPMLVDQRGQYAGSWFAFNDSRFSTERCFWPAAIDGALRAAADLQVAGYFGPLGIDAMIYRDESGSPRLRSLQDINARWTMGRLGLGWNRLLDPGDEGCWQHSSALNPVEPAGLQTTRVVLTSPKSVGEMPCFHASRVLIQRRS